MDWQQIEQVLLWSVDTKCTANLANCNQCLSNLVSFWFNLVNPKSWKIGTKETLLSGNILKMSEID